MTGQELRDECAWRFPSSRLCGPSREIQDLSIELLSWRDQFGDPRQDGVAQIDVSGLVPGHVVAFHELAFCLALPATEGPQHIAVAVDFQHLTVHAVR